MYGLKENILAIFSIREEGFFRTLAAGTLAAGTLAAGTLAAGTLAAGTLAGTDEVVVVDDIVVCFIEKTLIAFSVIFCFSFLTSPSPKPIKHCRNRRTRGNLCQPHAIDKNLLVMISNHVMLT